MVRKAEKQKRELNYTSFSQHCGRLQELRLKKQVSGHHGGFFALHHIQSCI